MKEMCTRNELNLILQAMTQAYQAVYGANVVKIILYGSYARGDYQKDSDIDIVAPEKEVITSRLSSASLFGISTIS